MATPHYSPANTNRMVVSTDAFKFRRVFGADYQIGATGDQPLSDLVLFLRNAWGVMFNVQPDANNSDRVEIFLTPLAAKGAAPFIRPDLALKAILNHEKIAPPETAAATIEALRESFIADQTEKLKAELGKDGQIFYDPGRNKRKPFAIVDFGGLEDRDARHLALVEAWNKIESRQKQLLRLMPLDVADLADVAPKAVSSNKTERQAFYDAVATFTGQHPAPPVAPVVKATTPDVTEAIIYLPPSLGQEVLNEWQRVSGNHDEKKTDNKTAAFWGDYLAELSAYGRVDIAYRELPDFRQSVIDRAQFQRNDIANREAEYAKLCADKANDPDNVTDQLKKRIKKLPDLIEQGKEELAQLLVPRGEVVRLKQPLSVLQQASDAASPPMAALHISLKSDTLSSDMAAIRLDGAIEKLEWLVKKRDEQIRDYVASAAHYQEAVRQFWERHPEYAKAGEGNPEAGYQKAVAAYEQNLAVATSRQYSTPAQRDVELLRIAKQNPAKDRPKLPSPGFISLGELTRRLSGSRTRNSIRHTPPVATQTKTSKKPLTAARLAAEAEIMRSHVTLPIASEQLLTAIVGEQQAFLNELKSHFGVKLVAVKSGEDSRILIPMNKMKQGRVIERGVDAKIMPVLRKMIALAEIRPLVLSDVRDLLKPAAAPVSASVEQTMAAATAEIAAVSAIPLTSKLTKLQLDNLLGPDQANLKQISDHFSGLSLSVRDNTVYVSTAALDQAKRQEKRVLFRLVSVMESLQEIVDGNKPAVVTALNVTRAIEQSFDARNAAVKELGFEKLEIPGLENNALIDRVMLKTNKDDITHSPEETIFFTELGKSVLKKMVSKENYLLSRIREQSGLTQIIEGTDSLRLVGKQKKVSGKTDDGLEQLEKTRNNIIALAQLIVENRYNSLPEYETAWNFLTQPKNGGVVLPQARSLESAKTGAGNPASASGGEGVAIRNINAFIPEGNQIYADEVMKDTRYGIAAIIGPAGTGKTELALINAVQALANGTHDKIIIATPMVTVGGGDIGALPGSKNEKIARWFVKHKVALAEILAPKTADGSLDLKAGTAKLDALMAKGAIQFEILEDMRGNNYKKTIVIVDEAQNATREQLMTALTRIQTNSKIWLTGDLQQQDGRKLKGHIIKLPNTVSLKDGFVEMINKGRRFVLGLEQDVGQFLDLKGILSVKAHNALGRSVMLHSNASNYAVAALDRSDIHRHPVIGELLALEEAAAVADLTEVLGRNAVGTYDPMRTLADEAKAVVERKSGVRPATNRVVQLRPGQN